MKTVVEVTPSYIGTLPAAIILVLTDREIAEAQMGTQGREHLSRIDAGAAAEHIALAAVALGLGCYLFRCSSSSCDYDYNSHTCRSCCCYFWFCNG